MRKRETLKEQAPNQTLRNRLPKIKEGAPSPTKKYRQYPEHSYRGTIIKMIKQSEKKFEQKYFVRSKRGTRPLSSPKRRNELSDLKFEDLRRRSCEGSLFGIRKNKILENIAFEVVQHKVTRFAEMFLRGFDPIRQVPIRDRKSSRTYKDLSQGVTMTLGGKQFTIILKNMFNEEEDQEVGQKSMCSFLEPITVIQKEQPSTKSSKRESQLDKQKLSFLLPGARINNRSNKITSARSALQNDVYMKNIFTVETARKQLLRREDTITRIFQLLKNQKVNQTEEFQTTSHNSNTYVKSIEEDIPNTDRGNHHRQQYSHVLNTNYSASPVQKQLLSSRLHKVSPSPDSFLPYLRTTHKKAPSEIDVSRVRAVRSEEILSALKHKQTTASTLFSRQIKVSNRRDHDIARCYLKFNR